MDKMNRSFHIFVSLSLSSFLIFRRVTVFKFLSRLNKDYPISERVFMRTRRQGAFKAASPRLPCSRSLSRLVTSSKLMRSWGKPKPARPPTNVFGHTAVHTKPEEENDTHTSAYWISEIASNQFFFGTTSSDKKVDIDG